MYMRAKLLVVKKMCSEVGFEGQSVTNHSLRATAATRRFAAGVDEQLIAEKTRHTKIQSLLTYNPLKILQH